MNSDNLKYVLRQFAERTLPRGRPRELVIPTGTGKVVGLAGVRRSGKTFLFFDTINRLAQQGVDRRSIVYLNFEDDRLHPLAAEELDLVLRCLHELYPETLNQKVYLFLDEVQNVPGWERWVRRIQDTENVEIFVTGSSSRLLARDLTTALRGRSITLEVFPLSFREALTFRGIDIQPHSAENESLIRGALEAYLAWGGFPEIVLADETVRPLILEEYASLMFYRDIVERYGVRNEKLMRALLRHAFRNTASLVNVSKLHRDFQSLGFSVSKNTLFDYLEYLQDAFLIFLVPRQEESLRKQAHNPRKLHVIDPGLVAAFKTNAGRDVGHKLETAVYLEVRRTRKDLYYYSNGSEVDLCDGEGTLFINTCWSLTEAETRRREVKAMEMGCRRWPEARGHLLYHEYSPGIEKEIIQAAPAWKYLMGAVTYGKQ
ncbi:MAG: ATP-binding protein [Deltaproteobacteria bacterium]|nr:ATP-binding protein [Deltaproteobacteria bacterium]